MDDNSRKGLKFILFVAASILLHIVAFYSLIFINDFLFFNELERRLDHTIVDRTKDLEVQIELVDSQEHQVVEQNEDSLNDEVPEDSKFLSANDQKVDKQTKASVNGAFQNRTNQPQQPSPMSQPQPQQNPTPQTQEVAKQSQLTPPQEKATDLGLTGLPVSHNHNEISNRLRTLTSPKLSPSSSSAVSQTDDYLEDIDEGALTQLNTKQFKFFSFYSRVKDQLRSHWNPLIREQVSFMFTTQRSLASLDKKRTSLKVTIDQNGYLEEIALVRTSGNKDIDSAAIQAFRLAAPFPNPPTEMLEKDKKIRIFWDFVLET